MKLLGVFLHFVIF